MSYPIFALPVFFSVILFVLTFASTLHAAVTCTDTYLSGSTVPTGYGASYNFFSAAKELLVKTASCTDTSLSIKAGNDDPNTLVYKEGWYWNSAWFKYAFTSTDPLLYTYYYPKAAAANIPIASGNTSRYYVAYTCQKVGTAWKCGCKDATCTAGAWQLQKGNKTSTGPGTPVCGNGICESGESASSCSVDCGTAGAGCDVPKGDLFKNPFNKNSAFHRPIGTGAVYAGASDPTTVALNADGGFGGFNAGPSTGWGHRFTESETSDPSVTIRFNPSTPPGYGDGTGLPVTLRMPAGYDGGPSSDGAASVYDDETETVHAFYRLAPPYAAIHYQLSARGLGHKNVPSDPRISTSASGLAQTGTTLRGFEINTAGFRITHALNLTMNAGGGGKPQQLKNQVDWPAGSTDAFCKTSATLCKGPIPYGALFAIPPVSKGGPDLNSLGLSEPGKRLAEALRDYGAYVHDTSSGVHIRGDQFVERIGQLNTDMKKIFKYLRMVQNNEKGQTASGGGSPLAPNCAFDAD